VYIRIVEWNSFPVSATHILILKCCMIDQPGAVIAGLYLIVCNTPQEQCFSKQLSVSLVGEQNKTGVESLPDCVEIPSDGTDVWEIDTSLLKVENKVASGSYGDL